MSGDVLKFPPIGSDLPLRQALELSTLRFDDIALARRAAAEVSKRQGYPMDRAYLSGDNDADPDVQSALVAIKLIRRLESVQA